MQLPKPQYHIGLEQLSKMHFLMFLFRSRNSSLCKTPRAGRDPVSLAKE